MKKFVSLILVMIMTLLSIACGEKATANVAEKAAAIPNQLEVNTTPESTVEPTAEPTPEPTAEPTPEPTPTREPTIEDYFRGMTEDMKKALIQNQNDSQNGAEYLVADGWIYGVGLDRNNNVSLVKWRTNFSDKTVLINGIVSFPYLRNAYLYCMLNQWGEEGIYRMRVSGDDVEKLSDAYGQMQIWSDTIYFSDEKRDYHLYKMNLDGNGEKEVLKKAVFHWYVIGDYVLYQDDADGESLHLMQFDGKDIKLNSDRSYFPIYDGDYIYYVKAKGENKSIWRINIDGTEDTKIADCFVSDGFAMYEDKLYFIYRDDSNRVYCINKDGSGLQMISQDKNCQYLQFMGDILKYDVATFSGNQAYLDAIKLCKPDGTLMYALVD